MRQTWRGADIQAYKQLWNRFRIAHHVDEARRKGKGLITSEWQAAEAGAGPAPELVESLITWCKDALANCRRPYGVDQFDLVLHLRTDKRSSSVRFNRLRPLYLYQEAFAEDLARTLGRKFEQADALVVHVKAGVFSWGNAVHAALATEQPRTN